MNDEFAINLMRMIAAELHLANGLVAAREMFGKSYFALGTGEKTAVDQAVFGMISGNYRDITAQFLAGQETPQPVGFPIPEQGRGAGGT